MKLVLIVLAHLFYSSECCSDKDCHSVPCAEVVDAGQGWVWQGHQFTKPMLRSSEDGGCHVCIGADHPRCIYLPSSS